MKAVVAAFNQEKALVGAFSVITNLRMELFEALAGTGGSVRGSAVSWPHHVSHADLSSIRLVLDNWSWFYSLSLHWDFTGPVCGFIQMSMPVPNLLWVHFLHFSWTLVLRKRICLAVSEMKHCVLACKLPGSHLANGNFTEKSTLFISFYFVSK